MELMKVAVLNDTPGRLVMEGIPMPEPHAGEVRQGRRLWRLPRGS